MPPQRARHLAEEDVLRDREMRNEIELLIDHADAERARRAGCRSPQAGR